MLVVYKNDTKEIVGVFENGKEHTKEEIFPQYRDGYTGINTKTDANLLGKFGMYIVENNKIVENPKNNALKILDELKNLDREIAESRALEDIILGNPINQTVLNLISQRQYKRAEYADEIRTFPTGENSSFRPII